MKNKLNKAISKFGRELLCFGDDACICYHSEESHESNEICLGMAGPNLDIDCRCMKYHPKDNLVYLEYKAKEFKQRGRKRNKN